MKTITISSPAKINLSLDVFPKKPGDNFHEIKTIFHKIDLADEIEITQSPTFTIEGFDFPSEENLIYKAFQLIQSFFPDQKISPVKVKVKKNIPIQGGLGGGSSNFANFIQEYFQLFELGNIPIKLIEKSAEYGKDIPFFFCDANCALGENFGEKTTPLSFSFSGTPLWIYQPDHPHSTAEMYTKLTNFNTNFTEKFLANPKLKNCGNAFDEFLENKVGFTMCGSGACFFSLEKKKLENCRIWEEELL